MTTLSEQQQARLIATLAQLREPFPRKQIGKLPATPKRPALDYVGHAAVTDRLNKYAWDWTYTIDDETTHAGVCWVRITMTICDVSRSDYGDGDDPKEALGNAIRRAAMRFGVAIDLWSKEELDQAASPESSGLARSPASASAEPVAGPIGGDPVAGDPSSAAGDDLERPPGAGQEGGVVVDGPRGRLEATALPPPDEKTRLYAQLVALCNDQDKRIMAVLAEALGRTIAVKDVPAKLSEADLVKAIQHLGFVAAVSA